MNEIAFAMTGRMEGVFTMNRDGHVIGNLTVEIAGDTLTAYHVGVNPEYRGKGYALELVNAMAAYAREHQLRVVPVCPYIRTKFVQHRDTYADIWKS